MTTATIVLWALAIGLFAYAWSRKDGSHLRAISLGWSSLKRTIPVLLLAFGIVGYVNILSPQDLVRNWIGPQSGFMGLVLGEFGGMLLPGGPYVIFPLIATLYQAGAGVGPMLTMITSWASLALLSVSFEVPFVGWRFSAIRLALGLPIPLLIGVLGYLLVGL